MSDTNHSSCGDGETLAKLDEICAVMRKKVAAGKRSNVIFGVVATLLLLVVVSYFVFGFVFISSMLEPAHLVDGGTQMFKENIPEMKRQIQEKVVASAPQIAGMATTFVLDYLPTGRETIENSLNEQLGNLLDETSSVTSKELRKFVHDNKAELKNTLQALNDQKEATEVVGRLSKAIEAQLGRELLADARELMDILIDINTKLARINEGKDLDAHDQTIRRMLMICKRIQIDQSTLGNN